MKRETEPVVKGEFTHPRTKLMLEIALAHAKAAFAGSCAPKSPAACMIYGGSAWNRGTYLTVIVDRCVCSVHVADIPFAAVETWIYDIQGDSPIYKGKENAPGTAELLQEPGDVPEASSDRKKFLKD